jgi:signal transduction histidine kinase/CheY-like chemotaxis protein
MLFFQREMEHKAIESTGTSMQTLLEATGLTLTSWSHTVKTDTKIMAQSDGIYQATTALLSAKENFDLKVVENTKNHLKKIVTGKIAYRDIIGFSVIAPDHTILASSFDLSNHWSIHSDKIELFLTRVFNGRGQLYFPRYNYDGSLIHTNKTFENTIILSGSPIYDANNRVIAMLTLAYDPQTAFFPLMQLAKIGRSSEIYAVDEAGYMLNPSHFSEYLSDNKYKRENNKKEQIPLFNKLIKAKKNITLMTSQLNKKNSGLQLGEYFDYSELNVMGRWQWLPELDFGLATEIDLSEAIASSDSGKHKIQLLSLMFICLLIFIYWLVIRNSKRLLANQIELKYLNSRLAERVTIRTKEAKVAVTAKGDFLAKMSHEIRTPMNGIMGMLEALSFTPLNKEQQNLFSTLTLSTKQLSMLLNDVIDFSRLDEHLLTLETTPIDLRSISQNVVNDFTSTAKRKNLPLYYHYDEKIPSYLIGDSLRITQLLNNIISNAIKFTEHGRVEVSINCFNQQTSSDKVCITDEQSSNQLIEIKVSDTGIGMSKEQQEDLFQPFIQAENNSSRQYEGSGLGLSICHELVNLMAGKISVQSVLGLGSVFVITLTMPIANQSVAQTKKTLLDSTTSKSPPIGFRMMALNVLVVEDNLVNQKVILGQLERLGITADVANDGAMAYQECLKNDYDLVLSDCHMPHMDGFEFAKRLNNDLQKSRPFIIAVTADSISGTKNRCIEAGFDGYLSKPFSIAQLEDKISVIFQGNIKTLRTIPVPPEDA